MTALQCVGYDTILIDGRQTKELCQRSRSATGIGANSESLETPTVPGGGKRGPRRQPLGRRLRMIIPVRCFTCGKVVGNMWELFLEMIKNDHSEGEALDHLGLKRYCCRRMLLTHVDLIEKLLNYSAAQKVGNNT
jgi:DNA-directed RNA polymerases I, II, and III subunit RPABC5